MGPREFFEVKATLSTVGGSCVILRSEKRRDVYETIRDAAAELKFACWDVFETDAGRPIMEKVYDFIRRAEIVMAVTTDINVNVFYELGIAHTIRDPNDVWLISTPRKKFPFDVGSLEIIVYENMGRLKDIVKEQLKKHDERRPRENFEVADGGSYDSFGQTGGSDGKVYKFRITGVRLLTEGNVQFDLEVFPVDSPAQVDVMPVHRLRRYGSPQAKGPAVVEERAPIGNTSRELRFHGFDLDSQGHPSKATFCVCSPLFNTL
jgi:hypothetical protein